VEQGALTLISQVLPDHVLDLRSLVSAIGDDVMHNVLVPFPKLGRVHFARWVVLSDERYGVQLVFESNYDGDEEGHLDELVHEAPAGLDAIYAHCHGYPPDDRRTHQSRKEFLRSQKRPHAALHNGHPGLSARRICEDATLRRRLQELLDDEQRAGRMRGLRPTQVRDRLRELLRTHAPELDLSPTERGSISRANTIVLAAALALGPSAALVAWFFPLRASAAITAAAVVGAGVAGWYGIRTWFRSFELAEQAKDKKREKVYPLPDTEAMRAIRMRENRFTQNPLTNIIDVKPGRVRLWVLTGVLALVELLARVWYVEGALGNITTIHFGRWVLLDDRRLLFMSNYDGSWESYLGDFIDKQAPWLTAVWTNTVGFPPTELLFGHGAAHEEDFKRWTLEHQLPTLCWYSAYPELSVRNVLDNALVRDGLIGTTGDDRQVSAWLRLL
jgi:hypothetical protein